MNENRLDIKSDYKKTPVEVLLFADDLIPKNHWEVQLTHEHFGKVGYKQVEKSEVDEYFKDIFKRYPPETRIHKYLDGTELYVNHKTARPYGAYKIAHEIRKEGYTVQVIAHPHFLTEEDVELIIDKFVGEETLVVGSSATFHSGYNPYAFIDSMYFPVARQRQIRKMIDKRNPNTKIIYGGSSIGEEYLRDPFYDRPMLAVDTLFVG